MRLNEIQENLPADQEKGILEIWLVVIPPRPKLSLDHH